MPPDVRLKERLLSIPGVSRETVKKLSAFEKLLLKWQGRINLVAKADDIWERHILDSLQLLPHLPAQTDFTLADLGSGAGFPGLMLACADIANITLIESDKRKAAFLQEAGRQLSLNLTISPARIEQINTPFDRIASRACASIDKLLSLSHRMVKPTSEYLLLKGGRYGEEVRDAQKNWGFHHEVFPSLTSESGVIIKLTNVQCRDKTPPLQ